MQPPSDGSLKTGYFYFGQDYSREQFCFLRSIETEVPEALKALKESVLSLFVEAKNQGIEIPQRDSTIWFAIWDWAHDWKLAKADEMELLKTPLAVFLFEEMRRDETIRALAPNVEPFTPDSAAIVFNLPSLAPVVLRTLEVWSEASDLNNLQWTFPEPVTPAAVQYGEEYAEGLDVMLQDEHLRKLIDDGMIRTPDPPPGHYTLKILAWQLRRETRKEGWDRIMEDLADKLRQAMDQHVIIAEKVGLYQHPQVTQPDQFKWLALFQVKGWNKTEIAEHVKETWPAKGTSVEHLRETVRLGIESAAELVIGPSWKSWLRQGQSGRPRRPRA